MVRPDLIGVEALEPRFLFAILAVSPPPVATVQEVLTSGDRQASEVVPLPASTDAAATTTTADTTTTTTAAGSSSTATTTTTDGATTTSADPTDDGSTTPTDGSTTSADPVPVGRLDLSDLAAAPGEPEVQVALQWGGGADPTDGTLSVLDASGAVLYQFPLVDVVALQASLPIPDGLGGFTPAVLAVDLAIDRADAGSGDPGSYSLSIDWQAASSVASTGPAVVASSPGSLLPSTNGISPEIPAPRGLTTSGSLPIPGGLPSIAPAGGAITFDPNILPGGVAELPAGLAGTAPSPAVTVPIPVPAPTPSPSGSPIGQGVGVVPAATPSSPGGGASSPSSPGGGVATPGNPSGGADRGQPAYVGPLPLGAPMPEGGVFARSFSQVASIEIGATRGVVPSAVPVLGTLVRPGLGAEVPCFALWGRGPETPPLLVSPISPARSSRSRSRPRLAENRAEGESTTVGLAFLPPLAAFSVPNARRRDQEEPAKPGLRSMAARVVSRSSIAAAVAALTTSAALVLRLSGPECLKALKAARSSKPAPPDLA